MFTTLKYLWYQFRLFQFRNVKSGARALDLLYTKFPQDSTKQQNNA